MWHDLTISWNHCHCSWRLHSVKWICQAPEEAAASVIGLVTSSSLPGRQPNAPQATSIFCPCFNFNQIVDKTNKFVLDLTIQVEQLKRRWGLQTTGRMACRLLETWLKLSNMAGICKQNLTYYGLETWTNCSLWLLWNQTLLLDCYDCLVLRWPWRVGWGKFPLPWNWGNSYDEDRADRADRDSITV